MTDLKAIAQQVNEDILNNFDWFSREVSFVMDGSHNSGATTYNHICETVDTTKRNYGKRGCNLIAFVGSQAIQDIYQVNGNQAGSIWNYLSIEAQKVFTQDVKDLLEVFEEQQKEGQEHV